MLELVVTPIHHAEHINQQRLYTSLLWAREDRTLRYSKGHLLVGVTYVRAAVLRAAQISISVVAVCR